MIAGALCQKTAKCYFVIAKIETLRQSSKTEAKFEVTFSNNEGSIVFSCVA